MSRRLLWWIAGAVILAALVAVYAVFDPAESHFPRCPFLTLTGLKCPGCGSQRAVHAMLHADFAGAFKSNALLVVSMPLVALMLVAQGMRRSMPRVYNALNGRTMIWIVFVVIIVWWIARNIWNLP